MSFILNQLRKIKGMINDKRAILKLKKLRERGMYIGKDVFIPMETWIDFSHCFLISIGDRCRFGPNCAILAHDATMNEFLDAGKVGRVIIHESCAFGFGTIILPGVEIGPRVISSANSVIANNIPANSIVAGNPARVIGSFDKFIRYHRMMLKITPLFEYEGYGLDEISQDRKDEMLNKLTKTTGYVVGGYRAMFGNISSN